MEKLKELDISEEGISIKLMQQSDYDALTVISQDERIWQAKREPLHIPDNFKRCWFDKAIEAVRQQKRFSYTIRLNGEVVGSSSFYHISLQHKRCTIGYTWFDPKCWGSGLNKKVKTLMLEYAFEILGMQRVAFEVDSDNICSCNALEKLGATREGVLRHHIIRADGTVRDTVVYSFIR